MKTTTSQGSKVDLSTKEARAEHVSKVAHSLHLEYNDTLKSPNEMTRKLLDKFIEGEIDIEEFTKQAVQNVLKQKANE